MLTSRSEREGGLETVTMGKSAISKAKLHKSLLLGANDALVDSSKLLGHLSLITNSS